MASPVSVKGIATERPSSPGCEEAGGDWSAAESRRHGECASFGFAQARPVCDRLRVMFGRIASEPVPDQLEMLARAVDAALEERRGTLGRI